MRDASFGYATMVAQDRSYKGLAFRQIASGIYFDDNVVIMRPEAAEEQLQALRPPPPTTPMPVVPGAMSPTRPSEPAKIRGTSRYHGTASLNPQRANKDIALIVDEIIQRLTSLTGTDVEITVEISAHRPAGFDDATVRTVSENSRTLKFKHYGFEKE